MGGFSIGMTEFLIMGILPDLSHSLLISIPEAGHLIAIYAFGVVLGAPIMTGLIAKFSPKQTLMLLMLLFTLFNSLFCLAPTYPLLMLSRFLSGLPHGAFFGIGAVVATHLAQPGKAASAVAMMFTGLTLANIVGVPLGTFIGHHLSWRLAYGLVACCGLVSLLSLYRGLPEVNIELKETPVQELKILKDIQIWLIIGISAIGTGGLFSWISYIAPLMTEVTFFSNNMITVVMMLAGIGMAAGNICGGRLADQHSPLVVISMLLFTMMLCLMTVVLVSENKILSLFMTLTTGAVAFAVVPAIQMLMIQAAKNSPMLASSLVQASGNMANTLGAYLGGLPIAAGFGYTSPEYVGIALVFIGLLLCFVVKVMRESETVHSSRVTEI